MYRSLVGLLIVCATFPIACDGTIALPPHHGASFQASELVARATEPSSDTDGPVSLDERARVLRSLLEQLDIKYVFPEKTKQVRDVVQARQMRGEYNQFSTGNAFAQALTADVNALLHDAHFGVTYSSEPLEEQRNQEETSARKAHRAMQGRFSNGGVEVIEHLPGNIGYIRVRSFGFVDRGIEAAAAAMAFIAETNALIIDVRDNTGGSPEMVAAWCSYFFDEPVHINDIYSRVTNETRQFWTSRSISGKPYSNKDVYILTSKRTMSAAEEFAYDMQTQKRGLIIGEKTWGSKSRTNRAPK